jgi:tetrapyrrole methylase family protein/MazG family protein
MITLVGLGPAGAGSLSVAARDALRAAAPLWFRTGRHPAAEELAREGLRFETFDALYEAGESFAEVYAEIARRVLEAGRAGDVAYAVPGHPLVGEEAARQILAAAREEGLPVRVVGSASFVEPALAAAGASLGEGLCIIDALAMDRLQLRTDLATLIYQVYDRTTASDVKLALMRRFPDEWEVTVVRAAGVAGQESVEWLPLYRLDRVDHDHLTSVYVPPLPEGRRVTMDDLVAVMARLRAEDGCPWDREQDHLTLRRYLFEECCEAIDAIDAGDMDDLCEELGDILLQIVFHAQIEDEVGGFTTDAVIAGIVEKLIRRHPHVFADATAEDPDAVIRTWERIKQAERAGAPPQSVLHGVPAALPALMRAMAVSRKAVRVGFEWNCLEDVLDKVEEELRELRAAIAEDDAAHVRAEIGDLLFAIVNVARWRNVDPEEALRSMLARFTARFAYIEAGADAQGRELETLTLAEMDALWDEAKAKGIGAS